MARFGHNLSQKGAINVSPKVNCYKDMGILRAKFADGINLHFINFITLNLHV